VTKSKFLAEAKPVPIEITIPGGLRLKLDVPAVERNTSTRGWSVWKEVLVVVGGETLKAELFISILVPASRKWPE
jgi:hypothetical protein